jgi:hypothetical protein
MLPSAGILFLFYFRSRVGKEIFRPYTGKSGEMKIRVRTEDVV